MKRKFILYAVIFSLAIISINSIKAQSVAINTDGTTAHGSAILDIKSSTKGMLAPRMTTALRTAIGTPAAGLLVYDTDTNSFWFYNGSAWSNLSASATLGWLLTGNSATNPGTHFIGTSDNQPLRFKVNNGWAGEIHPTTGSIFLGLNAGKSNTTGQHNTAFGTASLTNNLTGNENVAVGDSSLYSQNGTGTNVAVGTHTLFANTSGIANTAVGPYALWDNVDGSFNTAVGVNSLYHNISGTENTAVGSRALQFNTANYNTASGASALRSNSIGDKNTANGYQALYSNTNGFQNTATGAFALSSNIGGFSNTAIGFSALSLNTTGIYNTASGLAALQLNTIGYSNTANGVEALRSNTTGSENTAIGSQALYTQSTEFSIHNTAVGFKALFNNQGLTKYDGYDNTAIGHSALIANSIGNSNTAIGHAALSGNTSGSGNTAIGDFALVHLIGGNDNIAIGNFSGTDPGSPNVNNTISIGNQGSSNAASNQAFIGNASTTWIGGQVGWFHYSDARIKKNIKEEVKGLDFIMRLRPVTYNKNLQKMNEITGNKETKDFPEKHDVEKIKFSGFLAQEVEKAAKESGYDFDAVHKPKNEHDLYSLNYAEFVVPLVKAMQEQQTIIEALQKQIAAMQKEIALLKK